MQQKRTTREGARQARMDHLDLNEIPYVRVVRVFWIPKLPLQGSGETDP